MRFGPDGTRADEPEINLIAFIDVLLVLLIFLMLSTTFARYSELQLTLPSAQADAPVQRPIEIVVSVASDGRFAVDRQPLEARSVEALSAALAAAAAGRPNAVVIVSADALSAHQSVVNVLEAARRVGLSRLTFAAQRAAPAN
ncbi:MAG: biopolymer transport protein ExbD [Pseudomonadota bacterium]|jgi:biopolymer transport protein ExbD